MTAEYGLPLCQAAAMDAAACMDDPDLPMIPVCDEPAVADWDGWKLCAGCCDALLTLVALGARLRRRSP